MHRGTEGLEDSETRKGQGRECRGFHVGYTLKGTEKGIGIGRGLHGVGKERAEIDGEGPIGRIGEEGRIEEGGR